MNSIKNRRQFLALLGSAAAAGVAIPLISRWGRSEYPEHLLRHGFAIAGMASRERSDVPYFAAPRIDNAGTILIGNMAGTELKEIPTTFVSHQVIQNPQNLNQFFAIQKWGKHAAAVDFSSGQVLDLPLPDGFYFFGHGAFINQGAHILLSAMDQNKVQGWLLKYDTQTLKLVGEIPSFGTNPHEVQVSQDQKHLIVVNMGLPDKEREKRNAPNGIPSVSCLSRIDIESGRLLSQVDLNKANYGYSHFLNINDSEILCMGRTYDSHKKPEPPAVAYVAAEQVADLAIDPLFQRITGEALSACRMGSSVLISVPESNNVVLLDLTTRKPVAAYAAKSPRGVILTPQSDFAFVSQSDQNQLFMAYSVNEHRLITLQESQLPLGPFSSQWKAGGAHFSPIIWPA